MDGAGATTGERRHSGVREVAVFRCWSLRLAACVPSPRRQAHCVRHVEGHGTTPYHLVNWFACRPMQDCSLVCTCVPMWAVTDGDCRRACMHQLAVPCSSRKGH